MKEIPYASTVGSLMYAMLCTRPDIWFAVRVMSRCQSNPGMKHWTTINHVLKYLQRTRDYMLVYHQDELLPLGYMALDFHFDRDYCKSTFGFVFTLGGETVSWRNVK